VRSVFRVFRREDDRSISECPRTDAPPLVLVEQLQARLPIGECHRLDVRHPILVDHHPFLASDAVECRITRQMSASTFADSVSSVSMHGVIHHNMPVSIREHFYLAFKILGPARGMFERECV